MYSSLTACHRIFKKKKSTLFFLNTGMNTHTHTGDWFRGKENTNKTTKVTLFLITSKIKHLIHSEF